MASLALCPNQPLKISKQLPQYFRLYRGTVVLKGEDTEKCMD